MKRPVYKVLLCEDLSATAMHIDLFWRRVDR